MSQFAIITDTARKVKITIISKMVIPDIALIDPTTTVTMSPELTAETGMDALCHAFEAFVSNASSPLTDMSALSSVEIISDNLVKAYTAPENIIYRDKMMTASLMAGLAFSNASLGLVHSMAHSLGGAMGLPHGECNALLLEKVVQYNYPAATIKYDQLAKKMHLNIDDYDSSKKGKVISDHLAGLRQKLNIHENLSDLGVQYSDIPNLAQFAFMDPCLATNPQVANTDDIEKLYQEIYK